MNALAKIASVASTHEALEWLEKAVQEHIDGGSDLENESLELGEKWKLDLTVIKQTWWDARKLRPLFLRTTQPPDVHSPRAQPTATPIYDPIEGHLISPAPKEIEGIVREPKVEAPKLGKPEPELLEEEPEREPEEPEIEWEGPVVLSVAAPTEALDRDAVHTGPSCEPEQSLGSGLV